MLQQVVCVYVCACELQQVCVCGGGGACVFELQQVCVWGGGGGGGRCPVLHAW